MFWSIASRELRSLLLSPLAWVLLALLQLLLGWLFLTQLEQYIELQPQLLGKQVETGVTELVVAPFLESVALIFLLIIPLATMRSISEELRSGTYRLIYSSPIPLSVFVLAKYCALLCFLLLALLITFTMPLSLELGTDLDMMRLSAGAVGCILMIACACAISLFMSSLTAQPAVAAMCSYGVLLLLWLINLSDQSGQVVWLDWISLASHFRRMLSGLVQTSDLFYYLSLTGAFITLTIHQMESRRD